QQRNLRDYRLGTPLLLNVPRRQFQRAALVEPAFQVVLGLQHRDMLVHRGQRRQFEPARDLLKARAVAIFVDKIGDEIQHLLLPLRQCHRNPRHYRGRTKSENQAKSVIIYLTTIKGCGILHLEAAYEPDRRWKTVRNPGSLRSEEHTSELQSLTN